jgi:hypothetical protein
MPLTVRERDFLAAFIREATTDPFNGPATAELHRRNIYYTDLSQLMSAYYRQDAGDQAVLGSKYDAMPPSCPWKDRDAAARREQELALEMERAADQVVS